MSGGGGAFLHPTHTFENSIKVNFGGSKWKPYVRTVAYPSEKACYRLSWLNIWQFRWRNWRMDVLWGLLYLGIVSSLLPLCGIYESYVSEAHGQSVATHLAWYGGKVRRTGEAREAKRRADKDARTTATSKSRTRC